MNETSEVAKQRIKAVLPLLNERQSRLFLASEAKAFGFGGISEISSISGVSRVTITRGVKELETDNGSQLGEQRCRREGGGRKGIKAHYPDILTELEKFLDPYTKGDPGESLKIYP
jgi:hypothetical protein